MRIHSTQILVPFSYVLLIYPLAMATGVSYPLLWACAATWVIWNACRNMEVKLQRRAATRRITTGRV